MKEVTLQEDYCYSQWLSHLNVSDYKRGAFFKYYHETPVGFQFGVIKAWVKARENLMWKGMDKQINSLVMNCKISCSSKPPLNIQQDMVNEPMKKLYVDYVSPSLCSRVGNWYVYACIDVSICFFCLLPTCSVISQVSMKCLQGIFVIFGPCCALFSDNVMTFKSTAFCNFCFEIGMVHSTTTPYYPNTSFVGHVNRSLRAALIALHYRDKLWESPCSVFAAYSDFALCGSSHLAGKEPPN
ncbi:uncharacterized protein LOC124603037 [Schistocerca americana]|uniref:uncharacterized protein LOC124603037 n=1 Tax=Schistocerca americana TaxID=7009 RepID=UPI001F4FF0DF|nr:uncharacterized protein LOC124603037 [Schistocerca americana]XP_047109771.1 uncharacterized protein LOC124780870 [Schistocerca piceifrons]